MSESSIDQDVDAGDGLRVLLVEDEPLALKASQQYLSWVGCRVDAAANATKAFELAKLRVPDVVVCDWWLGGKRSGVDVARHLQQIHDVKVIFVTGQPLDELRDVTNDIAVFRYLRKPVALTVLAETIAEIRSSGYGSS